jgi:DNA-binding CsgD family transcriptional regulator
MDGIDATRRIVRQRRGDTPRVPMLTTFDLDEYVFGHSRPAPARPPELEQLTPREKEVLELMARGLSNTELAEHLYLSEKTVKTHVGRILMKLGLRDRVQAVILAYETGIVVPGRE